MFYCVVASVFLVVASVLKVIRALLEAAYVFWAIARELLNDWLLVNYKFSVKFPSVSMLI